MRKGAKERSKGERLHNEVLGVLFIAITVMVLMSLVSYDPNDLPFYTTSPNLKPSNYVGIIGAYLAGALIFLVGLSSYIVPILTFLWGLYRFLNKPPEKLYLKAAGTSILFLASSSLMSMLFSYEPSIRLQRGGIIGLYLSEFLRNYFGGAGSYVIVVTLFLLSALLATELLFFPYIVKAAKWTRSFYLGLIERARLRRVAKSVRPTKYEAPKLRIQENRPQVEPPAKKEPRETKPLIRDQFNNKPPASRPEVAMKPKPARRGSGDYKLPSLDLLSSPPPVEERRIDDNLEENSRILEETLRDFGIEVRVTQVDRGPVITIYELEPAPGVKVTRITSLSDDIALAMKAHSVRVVAPIPGKSRVGVEVPNSTSTLVYLKEILESSDFQNANSKLTLALGKDVSGAAVVSDLSDMPHLLIAGTTGSGKTVCVNSLIVSMLFNASPDELKFIMVDPKMVELAVYNGIPHLICPVVTEPKKVQAALAWLVNEMEDRYRLFAKIGVRNIEIYNEKIRNNNSKAGEKEEDDEAPEKLPYIVVIIDELADLMTVASQEIENAIMRLAQLSRAVGIHMILATQRPSVDVITGVIKANFPARISFQVASKVDSRTVLDMNGADKLLGKGDMLFLRPGTSKPVRAQCTLIGDAEIERVVSHIKSQGEPVYDEEIIKSAEKKIFMKEYQDELFDEAARMVVETGHASVSMLQRRLGLGYTRAARLIDMMEEKGIVGPYRGSKPREILTAKLEEGIREDAGDDRKTP